MWRAERQAECVKYGSSKFATEPKVFEKGKCGYLTIRKRPYHYNYNDKKPNKKVYGLETENTLLIYVMDDAKGIEPFERGDGHTDFEDNKAKLKVELLSDVDKNMRPKDLNITRIKQIFKPLLEEPGWGAWGRTGVISWDDQYNEIFKFDDLMNLAQLGFEKDIKAREVYWLN